MLSDDFQFSQAKLQDYVDCPRRFQLRHVLMQPWPALIAQPAVETEQHIRRGADFHRLAHQHILGITPDRLEATIHDPVVARWWQTYLQHPPESLRASVRQAETVVAAPMSGYRLLAKYDLLALEPGESVTIVDWKTSLRKPTRQWLAGRLQTIVYRYLAVEALATLWAGLRPDPAQVQMIYWLAEHLGQVVVFPYDSEQHSTSRAYLTGLIAEISAVKLDIWPLTPNRKECRFCNYRSLCDRGVSPGFLRDVDMDLPTEGLEIDLAQISEVEF